MVHSSGQKPKAVVKAWSGKRWGVDEVKTIFIVIVFFFAFFLFILSKVYREVLQRMHEMYDITLAAKGTCAYYSISNIS